MALFTASLVCYGSAQGILVSGTVTDTDGEGLVGAQVTFTAEADPDLVFTATTGTHGSYEVVLPAQVAVEEDTKGHAVPNDFELFQNYPNPFNPSTLIPYTLAKRTEVELAIYNILGQRVRTLVQEVHDAGSYAVIWDGRDDRGAGLAAGVYIYRLRCGTFARARKMVMIDGAAAGSAVVVPMRPLRRPAHPQEVSLYAVKISGQDIFPFVQRHIPISGDVVLDFEVEIYVQVQGTVSLPQDSPVAVSELQVVSFVQSSPVETSGDYATEVVKTEKPQLIAYVKDGKPILLGYLFPKGTAFPLGKAGGEGVFPLRKAVIGATEGTVADARTTALALAMMSPLLVFSSGEQRAELAQAVVNERQFQDLVSGIEEVLRTDPETVLDGEAHPEIYQQAAEVLVAAIESLGGQGKTLLVQGGELPWVQDRAGSKLALINPQNIYYGTGIYSHQTGDKLDVFLLPPKDGIVDFHWGLNFITWAEDTETEKALSDGEYTFAIYKGIVNDFPLVDLFSWSHPAGRATVANLGTAFLDILDIIIGIKLHPEFSGLHLYIGGVGGLTEHMLAGDVVAVLGDIGSLLLSNLDNIGLWLWEGAVEDSQRQLLNTLMPIFGNVAWPLKVLNVVPKIPFYYDLVTAPSEARYTYAIREGNLGLIEVGERVLIPAGSFQMGDHFNQGSSASRPVHTVYVDAFYIDKYEVTNAQYSVFLNEQGNQTEGGYTWLAIGSSFCLITKTGGQFMPKSGYEDHPVIKVTWYGACAYAQWAGKRLPTEAEWEKAARARLVGKRYPWGDQDPAGGRCNYRYYSGPLTSEMSDFYKGRSTLPVGSFEPNGYGLYDMAGNVKEWCNDWYDSGYYNRSPENNPTGPQTGTRRVLRGGSWRSITGGCRVANRGGFNPWITWFYGGFRCARTP